MFILGRIVHANYYANLSSLTQLLFALNLYLSSIGLWRRPETLMETIGPTDVCIMFRNDIDKFAHLIALKLA